ncbi:uncharacterized protein LOC116123890 [Pistacia vera]|uniref:uncharacterized protein LOC116123890 n=1 Tax=Pistacia vera TaxID=55513 RepID=UPI001262BD5D|nr:uncharacterized protein LOC116123890 [Pistacia vera]
MAEENSLSDHVLKMIKLIEQVEGFDLYLEYRLQVNLILQSLSRSFKSYITNFNMNKLVTTIETLLKLHGSLKSFEKLMKGDKETILAISSLVYNRNKKKKGKKPFSKT